MVTAVFVYGTLMPGHLRWALLAPHATTSRPARVGGVLFDTGRGWPAARFHAPVHVSPLPHPPVTAPPDPAPEVPGWMVTVDGSLLDRVLDLLDDVEDAVVEHPGLEPTTPDPARTFEYRRVVVRTDTGHDAWAYEAVRVLPHWPPIDSWAGRAER